MKTVETFANAPIVEAILSIEVNYLDDLVTPAEPFYQAVRDQLPLREEITAGGLADRERGGYRLASRDGLQVLQITRNTFSFHRLRPYTDWDRFAGAAHAFWRDYLHHFNADIVRGANLRYLNRIDLPAPYGGLGDYISLSPNLPAGLASGFSGYLLRLSLAEPSIPAVAYVTQRTEYDPDTGVLPLLFDIDVRAEIAVPIGDERLWRVMEQLREYKNRLFFSSITDAARELFR